MKNLYAADIHDNQLVDSLFLVSAKNHGVTKAGNGYLVVKLLDRSGEIEGPGLGPGGRFGARVRQERLRARARAGDVVSGQNADPRARRYARGRIQSFRRGFFAQKRL